MTNAPGHESQAQSAQEPGELTIHPDEHNMKPLSEESESDSIWSLDETIVPDEEESEPAI